jgi:hypothetical protein
MIVVFFMCSVGILIGCTPSPSNPIDSKNERAHIEALKQKADTFAQSEMAWYNAIELIYKNIPELHTTRVPINKNLIKGWTKTYRRFTEYEVVDIVR